MKDGRVKLEENELRVGNFFVKREKEHLKITDLNGVFSFRAHAKCAVGIWLDNMWIRARRENDASARYRRLTAWMRANGIDVEAVAGGVADAKKTKN